MAMSRWLWRRKRCICLLLVVSSVWLAFTTFAFQPISGGSTKLAEIIQKKFEGKLFKSVSHKYFDDSVFATKLSDVNVLNDTRTNETHSVYILPTQLKIENKTISTTNRTKTTEKPGESNDKNNTLEHRAVLDMLQPKKQLKFLSFPDQWHLNISFEDIGNIMKDTEFLNKLQPLDFLSPVLASTQNRTANYTYQMKYHKGFCDCWERNCLCCAKLANKRLHLNKTLCSNFTFVSKTHELDLVVLLDGKIIHNRVISADEPPVLCLGSIPKVCDICVHFFNVTFKVNAEHVHKTQLLGCTDFSLNLYNKTIGAHPVDCFQIPGDPNRKHKDRPFHFLGNWMP